MLGSYIHIAEVVVFVSHLLMTLKAKIFILNKKGDVGMTAAPEFACMLHNPKSYITD